MRLGGQAISKQKQNPFYQQANITTNKTVRQVTGQVAMSGQLFYHALQIRAWWAPWLQRKQPRSAFFRFTPKEMSNWI